MTDVNLPTRIRIAPSRIRSGMEITMKLKIAHLYPDLLNLYSDLGNICCMQKRLIWRGIEVETTSFTVGDTLALSDIDILLLGGGSDREQELAARYLLANRAEIKAYVEDGQTLLAVCGGYQILGSYYETAQKKIPGLEILNIHTRWQPTRLIGNVILKSPLFSTPVIGFENHGGRTQIGAYLPFGKTLLGFGNTDDSGYEGVLYKNVLGTYLHGPLLPKNPQVCDSLLERALLHKYGKPVCLPALQDNLEYSTNRHMVKRLLTKRLFYFHL